jgi:hypothetical protein
MPGGIIITGEFLLIIMVVVNQLERDLLKMRQRVEIEIKEVEMATGKTIENSDK